MKKYLVAGLATGTFFLTMAGAAQAEIILDEDFSSATIANNLTISGDPLANLGQWIDFPDTHRWSTHTNLNGEYAQHLEQERDNTNILFYGIDQGIADGTAFSFDFDYVTTNRNGRVVVAGLQDGVHSLDPFAPWFGGGDTNDGVILLDEPLARNRDWDRDNHYEFLATSSFDAVAVAFMMGGTTGFRAVDNILLDAEAPEPIPEPATMLLFGTGLASLAGSRLRKNKK
ncbi:MAG: PEP-CTERM sorting domain-containing protein [Thermodesulfobacteriota bacterium]